MKLCTLFKTQHTENHTLFSGTYPFRPNKGVPRHPPTPKHRRYNLSKSRNFTDVLCWGYKLAPHHTKVCKFPQFWGAVFVRLRRIPSKFDNFINFKTFSLVSTDFPKLVHIKSFTNNTRENRPIRRVVISSRLFFSSGSLKICFSSCLVYSLDLQSSPL